MGAITLYIIEIRQRDKYPPALTCRCFNASLRQEDVSHHRPFHAKDTFSLKYWIRIYERSLCCMSRSKRYGRAEPLGFHSMIPMRQCFCDHRIFPSQVLHDDEPRISLKTRTIALFLPTTRMADTHPPFDKLPLDQSQNSLRLWRFVDKVGPPADLRLRLETFALDACPDYIALSYAWGEKSLETLHPIAVNDGHISITKNLSDFLNTLHAKKDYVLFEEEPENIRTRKRKLPEHEWFWADQISINQVDVKERDQQVMLMSDIFYDAVCVYTWLSDIVHYTDIPDLEDLNDPIDHYWASQIPYLSMAASDYWTRLWIVQELTMARDVWLWSRCLTIHEKDFHARAALMDDLKKRFEETANEDAGGGESTQKQLDFWQFMQKHLATDVYNWFKDMQTGYVERTRPTIMSLLTGPRQDRVRAYQDVTEVLYAHGGKECSDPRDKVYGLQGLIQSHLRVHVDYTKTAVEVGRAALWSCVKTIPLEVFTAHQRQDWVDKVSTIAQILNVESTEVTTLIWAYGLPGAIGYLAVAHNHDSYVHISWGQIYKMSNKLATTRMQISFAKELNTAAQALEHPAGDVYSAHTQDTRDFIKHWARVFMKLVIEIADRCGFLMHGDCLRHPDDPWPWPEGDPLPMYEYYKWSERLTD